MGRKKKVSEEVQQPDEQFADKKYFYGSTYICPNCKEEFTLTTAHRYLIQGCFTCSWKCFIEYLETHKVETTTTKPRGPRQHR